MSKADLTPKQARFVAEYLKDLNATQAAIRAGYSEAAAEVQGSRLLSYAKVAAAIQTAMDKRAKKTEVTQAQVVNELRKIAFAGMNKLARWNASGVEYKDSSELDEDTLASVSEITETTNQHGGSLKVKQHDKLRALELLGKHLGMFIERVEYSETDEPDDPRNQPTDTLKQRLRALRAKSGT